jgi:hypothetical protein
MANELQKYILYRYEKNTNKRFDVRQLSDHPCVTWNFIQEHPEFKWDNVMVSLNPNISIDIVDKNPDYNWEYSEISRLPDLTWEYIRTHILTKIGIST